MKENNDEKTSTSADTKQLAGLLVGGGALAAFYLIIKKNHNIFSWILPVGMIAAGINLTLKERHEQVVQTGDQIIAQLDELDPLARAAVVKYVADQKIEQASR